MTDLSSSFSKIYPKVFELKVEYRGKHAATFLDLDITIKDSIFIYKLFYKRDKFMYFIVRMLHMSSNILSKIQIKYYIKILPDFIPRTSEVYLRMVAQGGNRNKICQ